MSGTLKNLYASVHTSAGVDQTFIVTGFHGTTLGSWPPLPRFPLIGARC
jgi:hypothetical protein